jgi:glyoxylase-like metal-dependent hydrolase (beta-lactamase superfamily II)
VKKLVAIAVIGVCVAGLDAQVHQQTPTFPPKVSFENGLEIIPLRANVFAIYGAGGNIVVQTGPDGAVVVDAGTNDKADAVIAAIQKRSETPIRYVIDTSANGEHVGANDRIAKAGETLFPIIGNPANFSMTNGGAAAILAFENVLLRLSKASVPTTALPTETFNSRRKYVYLNAEPIEVLHQPSAVTDGDSVVFFRRSDVIATGDIVDVEHFPVINIAKGGSVQGELDALNRLIEIAVTAMPLNWRDDATLVVPGHGRICDQTDVVEYRDMLTIVRDRIRALIKQGKTLGQVKAASPTAGYNRRYGSDTGAWTTAMFVEAVYSSLAQSSGDPR